ncbi:MAG: hypothetical protein E7337_11405 [Clostridiales bacterium]|nr:hypothetical protein [Clostridiales bacterium]
MSKEPIYRIKVEVIGEEKEGCKLDESLRGGVECSGFVILSNNEDHTSVAMHAVSNMDIATMIAPSGEMMAASLIAQAMREGKKYLNEARNPLADILKAAMSK